MKHMKHQSTSKRFVWPHFLKTAVSSAAIPVGCLALTASVAFAQQPKANYDEAKVGEVVLPEVLQLARGETITTARQWEKQRRPEVWQLF